MNRGKKIGSFLIILFSVMTFLPLFSITYDVNAIGNGIYPGSHDGISVYEWDPDLYTYWNNRIEVNITEPNIADRVNEPVNLFLNFDYGSARTGKFRVVFYNGSTWIDAPTQIWNVTSIGDYVTSGTITFLTNITKGNTQTYYLY